MAESDHDVIVTTEGDVTVLSFVEISKPDDRAAQRVGDQLLDLVNAHADRKILIDFSGVLYLASAAFASLIVIKKRVIERGGHLRLCGFAGELRKIIETLHLHTVFEIHATREEGLAGWK